MEVGSVLGGHFLYGSPKHIWQTPPTPLFTFNILHKPPHTCFICKLSPTLTDESQQRAEDSTTSVVNECHGRSVELQQRKNE